jgi:hypothetical protein
MKISVLNTGLSFEEMINSILANQEDESFYQGGSINPATELIHQDGTPIFEAGLRSGAQIHLILEDKDNFRKQAEKAIIKWLCDKPNFLKKLNTLQKLGVASEPIIRHERNTWFNCDYRHWLIDINIDQLTFPHIEIEGNVIIYGQCKELPEIFITKSARFRPESWFSREWFGNEYNGGFEYNVIEGAIPYEAINQKLENGYTLVARNAGYIDGWGSGYKGGAYIEKK